MSCWSLRLSDRTRRARHGCRIASLRSAGTYLRRGGSSARRAHHPLSIARQCWRFRTAIGAHGIRPKLRISLYSSTKYEAIDRFSWSMENRLGVLAH
jgi:hypothetical protein